MIGKAMKIIVLSVIFISIMFAVCMGKDAGYPEKNVQIIVPYATGGGTDSLARVVAAELEKEWGQTVIVVNKPGAASVIGTTAIAKAKNDGYTLGVINNTGVILAVLTSEDVPFKLEDFEYIASINITFSIFVAKKGSPFKTLQDVIKYTKENPRKLTVGITGRGQIAELTQLQEAAGIELTTVLFNSGGENVNALLGGHVDFSIFDKRFYDTVTEKGCKTLVIFGDNRFEAAKDVPNMKDLGYDSGLDTYRIFVAPKGTPQQIIDKIASTIKKVTDTPEFKNKFSKMNEIYKYQSGQELQDTLNADYYNTKKIVEKYPEAL